MKQSLSDVNREQTSSSNRTRHFRRAHGAASIPWSKILLALFGFYVGCLLMLHIKIDEQHDHSIRTFHKLSTDLTTAMKAISSVASVPHRPVEEEYRLKLKQMEDVIQQKVGADRIRSCRWHDTFYSMDHTTCRNGTQIYYYNPLPHERTLCGQTIGPQEMLRRNESCLEVSVFPTIPDRQGTGMPPITLRFNGAKVKAKPFPCDVPCRDAGKFSTLSTRTIDGTDWAFTFSMEGPQYYDQLKIDPNAYKRNHFYATTSYKSEVPLPYYSKAEYKIQTPGLDYDQAFKAAVFLARNCASRNHREDIIKKLQASSFQVDSLSKCLHNKEPPAGINMGDKTDIMRHYLFYLAFENQCEDDYITEKLWGPFEAGTVPVYFGAPNVKEHVPNNSLIHVDDYKDIDELAEHLKKVASDKKLYESYQAWRTQPLPPHFHAKYDFTEVHGTCRMCRWAYAKKYGLGWNHNNQSLRELTVPRDLCLDKQGKIVRPLKEAWLSTAGETVWTSGDQLETCNIGKDSHLLLVDDGRFRRTVSQRDGVFDILIENTQAVPGSPVELRFETSLTVDASLNYVANGHARFQDNQTRYSILMLPTVGFTLSSPDHGVLAIKIAPQDLPLRLRVIVEDIDTFHLGADQEENYFGKLMADDFFNPIEAFVKDE